ncbi:MAG: zf-HC2 domain-containing protein [Acidobacteria bacterium]|nr:zf-HC2 domain-containing protein [Acidobacteriota bacterium]
MSGENRSMHCKEVELILPLYFDGGLRSGEAASIDEHLDGCPVCRQRLADLKEIRSEIASLVRPRLSAERIGMIRLAVAESLPVTSTAAPGFKLIETTGSWFDRWLMPSMVGSLASLVLSVTLVWLIMSPANVAEVAANRTPQQPAERPIFLAGNDPLAAELTPFQYASTRYSVSAESPSVNPQGALIALTRSLLRGEMKDDEVVVVADVFGNGLARIAEVVEPINDDKAIRDLEKALQSDPSFAPFVPAEMDRRGESVRVVLRLQTVDVDTRQASPMN